jgi:hypothetical protein
MPRPVLRWCALAATLTACSTVAASGLSDTGVLFCVTQVEVIPVEGGVEARCEPDPIPTSTTTSTTSTTTSTSTTTTTVAPTTTVTPTTVAPTTIAPTTTVAPTTTLPVVDPLVERIVLLSSSATHEAPLYGVPSSWSWATNGRTGVWPPFTGRVGHNVWGQAVKADATTPTNVSLQVSLPQIHHRVNGVWQRVCTAETASAPGGGWFLTNSSGYSSTNRTISMSFDPATRISTVNLSPMSLTPPSVWHWWYTWPRCAFEADRGPVAMLAWMRLTGPDAAVARISAALAGDSYANGLNDTSPDGDLGIPRHALVTGEWALFGYVTASGDQIRVNPPPAPTKPD